MAQETIRINCVESTYIDRNNADNLGKTPELKVFSEAFVSAPFQIRNIAFLQFNIPEEIKKYKILSCELHINATVSAKYDEFGDAYYTTFDLETSTKKFDGPNGIYDVKQTDFLKKRVDKYGDRTTNTKVVSWDERLKLRQQYPNYTNFIFDFLTMKDTTLYTAEEFWDNFLSFFATEIAVISIRDVGGTWNDNEINQSWMYSDVTVQSSRTSSAPYLEVVVDKDYLPLNTVNTGFVDPHRDFLFSWEISPGLHLFDPMTTQKSAEFRLRKKDGETIITQQITEEAMHYLLLADTLENGVFEWQVSVVSEDGRSATSDWKEFTTQDSISKATNPEPNRVTLDGTQEIVFRWTHLIATNSKPRGFTIEYRSENAEWKTLADQQDTDQTYYAALPNTLPPGNIEWRVRTYNSNLVPGTWSNSASVIIRSAPLAPIITEVTSSPRPVISWQAEGQIQAEIKIGDTVKTLLSADKSYRWEELLQDGLITVSVRVKNHFNLWSPWASVQTNIKNNPSGQLSLSANVNSYAVTLLVNSQYPGNYIYRDGVLIAKAAKKENSKNTFVYVDDTALGKHSYYAVGMDEQGNYRQSSQAEADVQLSFGIIGEEGTLDWIVLQKRRGSFPSHTIRKKCPLTMVYYTGNPLPVAYAADELDASHTLEFTTDKTSADRLERLTGKQVIYKDVRGDLIIGVLASVECSRDRVTDIRLNIEETQREVVKIE